MNAALEMIICLAISVEWPRGGFGTLAKIIEAHIHGDVGNIDDPLNHPCALFLGILGKRIVFQIVCDLHSPRPLFGSRRPALLLRCYCSRLSHEISTK